MDATVDLSEVEKIVERDEIERLTNKQISQIIERLKNDDLNDYSSEKIEKIVKYLENGLPRIKETRYATSEELKTIENKLAGLYSSQSKNKVKMLTSKFRSEAWLATNKFASLTKRATNQKVTDVFKKGGKIGAATTVIAALIGGPALPALATVAAGCTLATYMAGACAKAINHAGNWLDAKSATKYMQADRERKFAENIDNAIADNIRWEKSRNFQPADMYASNAQYAERLAGDAIKQGTKILEEREREAEAKRIAEEKEREKELKKQIRQENWEEFKQGVHDKIDKVGEFASEIKTGIAVKANNIKHRVTETKNAIKTKMQDAKEERQERKEEKSQKCYNFLMTSGAFLGKSFIAEHVLTGENKKDYENITNGEIARRDEARKRINSILGTDYSLEEFKKMSDRKLANIEKNVQRKQLGDSLAPKEAGMSV
ncbi:MAG: hypothetical protein ACLRFE_00655 [Clostridia bacterium]